MSEQREKRAPMVSDEAAHVLGTVLAEHEPSISSYGDVACLCGEEFKAGESVADAGYRSWSRHVIQTFQHEGNTLVALRDVDAGYR